jgi:hypothetical protein
MLVIAAASEAGLVSLWDGSTNTCIALLDDPHDALSALRVCPLSRKACTCCGTAPPATFSLALSAGNSVWFYRVSTPPDPIPSSTAASPSCSTCLHSVSPEVPPWGPLLELRSQIPRTASLTPVLSSRVHVQRGLCISYFRPRRAIASRVREGLSPSRRGRHAQCPGETVRRIIWPAKSTAHTRSVTLLRDFQDRDYDVRTRRMGRCGTKSGRSPATLTEAPRHGGGCKVLHCRLRVSVLLRT